MQKAFRSIQYTYINSFLIPLLFPGEKAAIGRSNRKVRSFVAEAAAAVVVAVVIVF